MCCAEVFNELGFLSCGGHFRIPFNHLALSGVGVIMYVQ